MRLFAPPSGATRKGQGRGDGLRTCRPRRWGIVSHPARRPCRCSRCGGSTRGHQAPDLVPSRMRRPHSARHSASTRPSCASSSGASPAVSCQGSGVRGRRWSLACPVSCPPARPASRAGRALLVGDGQAAQQPDPQAIAAPHSHLAVAGDVVPERTARRVLLVVEPRDCRHRTRGQLTFVVGRFGRLDPPSLGSEDENGAFGSRFSMSQGPPNSPEQPSEPSDDECHSGRPP
jgi:hypothetical protein